MRARINYLARDSLVNRRFVASGVEVNTGRYEAHDVWIHDARSAGHDFSLDQHGFTLAKSPSRIVDFEDRAQVEAHARRTLLSTTRPARRTSRGAALNFG